jgi:hypothetical protein
MNIYQFNKNYFTNINSQKYNLTIHTNKLDPSLLQFAINNNLIDIENNKFSINWIPIFILQLSNDNNSSNINSKKMAIQSFEISNEKIKFKNKNDESFERNIEYIHNIKKFLHDYFFYNNQNFYNFNSNIFIKNYSKISEINEIYYQINNKKYLLPNIIIERKKIINDLGEETDCIFLGYPDIQRMNKLPGFFDSQQFQNILSKQKNFKNILINFFNQFFSKINPDINVNEKNLYLLSIIFRQQYENVELDFFNQFEHFKNINSNINDLNQIIDKLKELTNSEINKSFNRIMINLKYIFFIFKVENNNIELLVDFYQNINKKHTKILEYLLNEIIHKKLPNLHNLKITNNNETYYNNFFCYTKLDNIFYIRANYVAPYYNQFDFNRYVENIIIFEDLISYSKMKDKNDNPLLYSYKPKFYHTSKILNTQYTNLYDEKKNIDEKNLNYILKNNNTNVLFLHFLRDIKQYLVILELDNQFYLFKFKLNYKKYQIFEYIKKNYSNNNIFFKTKNLILNNIEVNNTPLFDIIIFQNLFIDNNFKEYNKIVNGKLLSYNPLFYYNFSNYQNFFDIKNKILEIDGYKFINPFLFYSNHILNHFCSALQCNNLKLLNNFNSCNKNFDKSICISNSNKISFQNIINTKSKEFINNWKKSYKKGFNCNFKPDLIVEFKKYYLLLFYQSQQKKFVGWMTSKNTLINIEHYYKDNRIIQRDNTSLSQIYNLSDNEADILKCLINKSKIVIVEFLKNKYKKEIKLNDILVICNKKTIFENLNLHLHFYYEQFNLKDIYNFISFDMRIFRNIFVEDSIIFIAKNFNKYWNMNYISELTLINLLLKFSNPISINN